LAAALDSADRRAGILTAQQSVAEASTWDAVAGRAVAAFERLIGGLDGGAEGMGGGIGGADGGTSGGTHWAASRLGSSWPARMALVGWPGSEDRLLRAIAADWAGVVDVVPSEGTAGEPATWLEPAPGGRLVSSAAFGVDVRPASYDQVVYVLSGGPADRWVCSQAGRYAGWLWLWRGGREAVAGGRLRLEPLVRRSRGLLVGSADDLDVLRLALRPMAAVPPIGVVGEDGSGLVAALRGMSA
jgi:hypothetical protein